MATNLPKSSFRFIFEYCFKFRTLSVTIIVILAAYNILIRLQISKIQQCSDIAVLQQKKPVVPSQEQLEFTVTEGGNNEINLRMELSRWDGTRQYRLYDNIIVGNAYSVLRRNYRTTLATQSSLDRLRSLTEVAHNWNGPISLALFAATPNELNALLTYVTYLRNCHESIRNHVTIHLVCPDTLVPVTTKISVKNITCSIKDQNVLKTIVTLFNLRNFQLAKWRPTTIYPQNLLRNVARKNSQTKYVFLTDVDIVPSSGSCDQLEAFLKRDKCRTRCAYVIPTYELDMRIRHIPETKRDLLRLVTKGLAQPFHHKVFIFNQFATNFSRWQQEPDQDSDVVRISHAVTNFEFFYEPFYVAPDTVPVHDERFQGYGFTRNTQVFEMYMAGYEFKVLSPIFTCHWGLQKKKVRPLWREQQNTRNAKRFEQFKKEILAKYGTSKRKL